MDLFASSSSPDPSLLHFVSALFQYLLEFMVVPEEKLGGDDNISNDWECTKSDENYITQCSLVSSVLIILLAFFTIDYN